MFTKIKNLFINTFFNTAAKRVAQLEKSIMNGIAKYGIKLVDGEYITMNYTDDICGCAIGSAILSTARNQEEFTKLFDKYADLSLYKIGDIALEIVNNGITKQELIDLEAGFEDWTADIGRDCGVFSKVSKEINIRSAFYQAGQRLRTKRAYNG